MSLVRVLIAAPSHALAGRLVPLFGERLRSDGEVPPQGLAERVRARRPSLVLLEVGDSALEAQRAVEAVMAATPVPIVLVVGAAAKDRAFPLLARGALDMVELPAKLEADFFRGLERQIELWASVKVVRHPRGRRRRSTGKLPPASPFPPLVAVAASLGGPKALAEVLSGLRPSLPAPVVVCQHITPGFTAELAQWLTAETGLRVQEAREGQPLVKGEVFLAPPLAHLVVRADLSAHLDGGPPIGGFRPSCDVLLRSAAIACGPAAVGVVLTGMGRDGAQGLLEVRRRGGHTIAQDQRTSAVFGMPGEAIALGAAEQVLPLGRIARAITALVEGRRPG